MILLTRAGYYNLNFYRYPDLNIPDAYESLILDCLNDDKSNFVRYLFRFDFYRDDDLLESWKIFTPLLHHIENNKVVPYGYTYGTRGPKELSDFIKEQGYVRGISYKWTAGDAANL